MMWLMISPSSNFPLKGLFILDSYFYNDVVVAGIEPRSLRLLSESANYYAKLSVLFNPLYKIFIII